MGIPFREMHGKFGAEVLSWDIKKLRSNICSEIKSNISHQAGRWHLVWFSRQVLSCLGHGVSICISVILCYDWGAQAKIKHLQAFLSQLAQLVPCHLSGICEACVSRRDNWSNFRLWVLTGNTGPLWDQFSVFLFFILQKESRGKKHFSVLGLLWK